MCPIPTGNPVHPATGNKFQREIDYVSSVQGGLRFERNYNSQSNIESGTMGSHWRTIFDSRVDYDDSASYLSAIVWRADGKAEYFTSFQQDEWVTDWDNPSRFGAVYEQSTQVGWSHLDSDDVERRYDMNGKLVAITTRDGFTQMLDYEVTSANGGDDNDNTLDKVTDPFGRTLTFTHVDMGGVYVVETMTTPDGEVYEYAYDAADNLESVTSPDEANGTSTRIYRYENVSFVNALTGITDENGDDYATWEYDTEGRATLSLHGGALQADRYLFDYDNTTTDITDPLGRVRTATWDAAFGLIKPQSLSGGPCPTCGSPLQSLTYDANGYLATSVDFNGNETLFTHDTRGLEVCRIEGIPPAGAPDADKAYRRTLTTWHADWRVAEFVRVYRPTNPVMAQPTVCDADPQSAAWALIKETQDSYTDGHLTQRTEADPTTATSRAVVYTYYGASDPNGLEGQLKQIDGPRDNVNDAHDVTEFFHETVGTADHAPGDLKRIRRYLTATTYQDTAIEQTDANGRPLRIRDPNGIATAFAYHPRGWLTAVTEDYGGADPVTTQFDYDNVGQLTRVTLPTGAYFEYEYDAAHRLTAMTDNLGNRMAYDLDLMGNRITEQTCAGACVGEGIKRVVERVYNNLNQLEQLIGGMGQITRFTYDTGGNLKRTIDARDPNPATPMIFQEYVYDALNRIRIVRDNLGGMTGFAHDVRDTLTQVTDPNGRATSYTPNAFGETESAISPDTGTTNNDYDPAGNLIQATDARNIAVTYQYDTFNRLTGIDYPSQTDLALQYDQGPSGCHTVGRLNRMQDEAGQTDYCHDARGNVTDKTVSQIPGEPGSFTTGYAYNDADQITTVTYPSGLLVKHTYDATGRVSQVEANLGQGYVTIVNNVLYRPFGPLASLGYGNGVTMTRAYDADDRITAIRHVRAGQALPCDAAKCVMDRAYEYDAADNITQITDHLGAKDDALFVYDALSRATAASVDLSWNEYFWYGYDPIGNRSYMQAQVYSDTSYFPYQYAANSNRLTSDGWRGFGHDPAGNTTAITGGGANQSLSYGEDNRLKSVAQSNLTVTFKHNGLGQRVRSDTSGPYAGVFPDRTFFYDEQGRVLAEKRPSGWAYEYLYFNDEPIAFIAYANAQGQGGGAPTLYYYHTDHLMTPRYATDAGQNIVWWTYPDEPFRVTAYTANVAPGLGFPGQYHDPETGMDYNYFRDYDGRTGRYIQADPIGLAAGTNTYLYSLGNPLRYTDKFGLAVNCRWVVTREYDKSTTELIEPERGHRVEVCIPIPAPGIGIPDPPPRRYRPSIGDPFDISFVMKCIREWIVDRPAKYRTITERWMSGYMECKDDCSGDITRHWGSDRPVADWPNL